MRKQVDLVNQSPRDQPDEVVEAIHAVMHLYRAHQYRVLRDGPHDLTHMEGKALGFFARHPGATQSDLVQHAGRDKGQVARLIGGLRERGLLEARADDKDRRSLRLQLSPAGRKVQDVLQQQGRQVSSQAVKGLDEAERQQLLALLARVQANLGSV